VVSDKIRVEALRLDQEFRTLSQFVEASAEKFERWERNRSDPSNAPATPLSSNDIHVPSTRSEVIEMKEVRSDEERRMAGRRAGAKRQQH